MIISRDRRYFSAIPTYNGDRYERLTENALEETASVKGILLEKWNMRQ